MLPLFLAWKSRWVLWVSLCSLRRHAEVLTLCLGICVNVTLFENRIVADVSNQVKVSSYLIRHLYSTRGESQ